MHINCSQGKNVEILLPKTKPSFWWKQTTSHGRGLSKYYVFCVGDKMIYHVASKKRRFGA